MEFVKNFFNDDSKIVGLCGFKTINKQNSSYFVKNDLLFNNSPSTKVFQTNYSKNILLV